MLQVPASPLQARRMAAQLLAVFEGARDRCKLDFYKPYPKQRDFHAQGLVANERLFIAANQVGKTIAGGAEWAIHLTGRYPDWWEGAYFDKPVSFWAAGVTGDATRDNPQRILVGPPQIEEKWGTGFIPKECLLEVARGRYAVNAIDSVVVRWGGGGDLQAKESILAFKTYEQGREKWQGPTLDGVWFDEEPPLDIYSEGKTRTNNGQLGNFTQVTFTPLLGMSEVVRRFTLEKPSGTATTTMAIYDALHYPPEQADQILAGYPEHERDARGRGIPVLGSGAVFPVLESEITVDPFEIPFWWPRIVGIDFGWEHPTAGAWLAWDQDNDIIYLYSDYRVSKQVVPLHVDAIRARGPWIPVSWPQDGYQVKDAQHGEQLQALYRKAGLNMLAQHAQFETSATVGERTQSKVSVEAGLQDMLSRMRTGRWKVFNTCKAWLEEYRTYHRKDGVLVKEYDDTISASRYAYMMLRYATTEREISDEQWQPDPEAAF